MATPQAPERIVDHASSSAVGLRALLLAYPDASFPILVTVIGVILIVHALTTAFISSTPR